MAAHNSARYGRLLNGPTVLLAAFFLLPGLVPTYFGWISGFAALPVFGMLTGYGLGQGTIFIRNAALMALAAGILLKIAPSVFFSLTLIPLGYSFEKSARESENEWKTGARACLVLCMSWLAFWAIYGAAQGVNPYVHLLELLDAGFAQTYNYYMVKADIPAENLLQLEQAVNELRVLVPRILPGVLICTVIMTVWINLVGSIALIERLRPGRLPWKKYSRWRLPDQMVWPAIAGAVLLIAGNNSTVHLALALVLASCLLFFFQGLAVFVYFLDKWKIPIYLRIVIYAILILQSYGLLLLTIAGLVDIWIDFRQRHEINNPKDDDRQE